MGFQIKKLRVPRTVHYSSSNVPWDQAELIWVVFHGYAQTMEEVQKAFEGLDRDRVIIPEGMSKFYRKGFYGDVVASWMTSRFREDEIQDQYDYLDALYGQIPVDDRQRIVFLGFSQGVATLLRWLVKRNPQFLAGCVYAGSPPEDILYEVKAMDQPWFFILGDQDEFIGPPEFEKIRASSFFRKADPGVINFQGKHQLRSETLQDLRRTHLIALRDQL